MVGKRPGPASPSPCETAEDTEGRLRVNEDGAGRK